MTTRMTVALAVLTLGLAVAALAGVPALIENRSVGDIVVIMGFAIAIVGVLLVILAIPGQRHENGKLKKNDEHEIEKLRVERRRLLRLRKQTLETLKRAKSAQSMQASIATAMTRIAAGTERSSELRAEIDRLETELIELNALLESNAAEFKRYGVADPDAAD